MTLDLKGEKMKKFLLLACMVFITNVADAKVEYYASVKAGVGGTTIYVNDNDKFGDYLVKEFEIANPGLRGYSYDSSGVLWEISPAVGLDWSLSNMYGKKHPYEWFHLRLEGELGYNNYHENGTVKRGYTVDAKTEIQTNQIFLLANGYADFRIDNIVPYIGLGLGYGFGREEVTGTNNTEEIKDSANDEGVIYALHAGVAYKYSDITTLDLGYRRAYMPTADDGLYVFQTVRLGARFRM